jgi:Family of unknown function (DUF5677)
MSRRLMMTEFSDRRWLVRYLVGTDDGRPAVLDLCDHPDLTERFETNEWLAGLVAHQASMKEFEIPPGPINPVKFVVLGAMATSLKTHSAIQLLCRQGYWEDAFARVRTLFEFALDLRYMQKDAAQTSELAQRWLDWARVAQQHLLGVLERGDDYFEGVRDVLADHPDETQSLKAAIERVKAKETHWYVDKSGNRRTHSHWSGKPIAEVAHDVGWEVRYDTVFREASNFIHPGMHGFTGFFRFEEPDLVTLDARPSADIDDIRGVLGDAAVYFAHVAVVWAETLHVDEVASKLRDWMGDESIKSGATS